MNADGIARRIRNMADNAAAEFVARSGSSSIVGGRSLVCGASSSSTKGDGAHHFWSVRIAATGFVGNGDTTGATPTDTLSGLVKKMEGK